MINNLKGFVNQIVPVQAMNLYVGWRCIRIRWLQCRQFFVEQLSKCAGP